MNKIFEWLKRYRTELRLSIRVTIAGLASYALTTYFHIPQGYWAIFTSILVVQSSVGGSVKAATDRFIGTLGGAIFGAVIATIVPHPGPFLMAGALAAGLIPLVLLSSIKPAYRIAPVTLVIVLISAAAQQSVYAYVIERITEIALGSVIGLLVSVFVLPRRANKVFTEQVSAILSAYASLLEDLLKSGEVLVSLRATAASLTRLETVAEEARHERRVYLFASFDPENTMRILRRLRNDIVMMARITRSPPPAELWDRLLPSLVGLITAMVQNLKAAAAELQHQESAYQDLAPAFAAYEQVMESLKTSDTLNVQPGNVQRKIQALFFALEQFRQDIEELNAAVHSFK